MLVTALNLLLTAAALVGFLALRRRWKAADRAIAEAEAGHARLDRQRYRRRLRDPHGN
ncbi:MULTISPECIES: hypothetical protein [Catenuloplanes]|uniref:Uncharacterized protein n=1 Tax=Catenuloplanes niger TaxID=587534 RepID=A0AAE3ZLX8_9ACTN|nr:hypothetical protein [Catenuloplanes niger]MDR7320295.1 hypothetical protein [Catenuloplanes niger]